MQVNCLKFTYTAENYPNSTWMHAITLNVMRHKEISVARSILHISKYTIIIWNDSYSTCNIKIVNINIMTQIDYNVLWVMSNIRISVYG